MTDVASPPRRSELPEDVRRELMAARADLGSALSGLPAGGDVVEGYVERAWDKRALGEAAQFGPDTPAAVREWRPYRVPDEQLSPEMLSLRRELDGRGPA